jgi:hypothetical protein
MAVYRLVQDLRRDAVEGGQVSVEQDALAADYEDPVCDPVCDR